MQGNYQQPLTEEQRKSIEPVIDRFESVLSELTSEMARLQRPIDFDEDPNLGRCRRCTCAEYTYAGLACKRCGHSRFAHEGGI